MFNKNFSKVLFSPFIIETDFNVNPNFFYKNFDLDSGWHDSNVIYKDYVLNATNGQPMNKFFVKPISKPSLSTLRLIKTLFNGFHISPKEFRYDFFKVSKGGSLPFHIDQKSKISICVPITENTCFTVFKKNCVELRVQYDKMILLNNLELHAVEPPQEERIIFRLGIHDIDFSEVIANNFNSSSE